MTHAAVEPRPFLKWAGGKKQLLEQFSPLYPLPSAVSRYIEPFVGSGAVFFQIRRLLAPRRAILCDSNEDLVNVYAVVRDQVEPLIRLLARHRSAHDRDHYYRVRGRDPRRLSPCARAARFIYLNKTCYNGLYRLNSRGEFNVPMGRYTDPRILDAPALRAASAALQRAELRAAHFRDTLSYARRGDFIYLDPPYDPLSTTASFTSYTHRSFGKEDQEELAEVFQRLHRRGCRLMLSNSDTAFIRRLYGRRGFRLMTVRARRCINSKSEGRGRIRELVILNYTPPGSGRALAAARSRPARSRPRA